MTYKKGDILTRYESSEEPFGDKYTAHLEVVEITKVYKKPHRGYKYSYSWLHQPHRNNFKDKLELLGNFTEEDGYHKTMIYFYPPREAGRWA